MTDTPTVAVSLEMKVNLGNYESAAVFLSVSGLEEGATEQEIAKLLDTGSIAFGVVREAMIEKIAAVRNS